LLASPAPAPDIFASDVIAYSQAPDAQIEDEAGGPVTNRTVLYSGRPRGSGEVILFDSAREQAGQRLPESGTINRSIVSCTAERRACGGEFGRGAMPAAMH